MSERKDDDENKFIQAIKNLQSKIDETWPDKKHQQIGVREKSPGTYEIRYLSDVIYRDGKEQKQKEKLGEVATLTVTVDSKGYTVANPNSDRPNEYKRGLDFFHKLSQEDADQFLERLFKAELPTTSKDELNALFGPKPALKNR